MYPFISRANTIDYRIVGYFRGRKFSRIELFSAFQRENFHKSSGVPIESKHFEVKFLRIIFDS